MRVCARARRRGVERPRTHGRPACEPACALVSVRSHVGEVQHAHLGREPQVSGNTHVYHVFLGKGPRARLCKCVMRLLLSGGQGRGCLLGVCASACLCSLSWTLGSQGDPVRRAPWEGLGPIPLCSLLAPTNSSFLPLCVLLPELQQSRMGLEGGQLGLPWFKGLQD